jgi:capsular polysaccharide biosynthesis protein
VSAALVEPAASHVTYTATAVVVVNSCQGSGNCPGSASEANTLATTYAGLIPKDQAVLGYVATHYLPLPEGSTSPAPNVSGKVSVVQESSTSLLDLRFDDPDPQRAVAGAEALAAAITSTPSVTAAVPTGAVTLVRAPVGASSHGGVPQPLIPIAVLLGLVLGGVVAFILERIDPRVDTVQQLASLLPCPVTDLSTTKPSAAVVARWEALASARPAVIGIVPFGAAGERDRETEATSVATAMARSGRAQGIEVDVVTEAAGRAQRTGLILLPIRGPEDDEACDIPQIVAVVRVGAPMWLVRSEIALLDDFGMEAIWGLLVGASVLRSGSGRESAEPDRPRGQPPSREPAGNTSVTSVTTLSGERLRP